MDRITKQSYFRFLTLYLLSSFILLGFAAYYFYNARVSMGQQTFYYKMTHIADMQGLAVIDAQMSRKPLIMINAKGFTVALFDKNKKLVKGETLTPVDFKRDFYTTGGITTLVSQSSAMHLGVKYVVVQTDLLAKNKQACRDEIVLWTLLIAVLIIITAAGLSYTFLQPVKERANQIERFVKDTAHELNTPISALMMSLEKLRKKRTYDERSISNISISIKNLHEIYTSLAYLSFSTPQTKPVSCDLAKLTEEIVAYYGELIERKKLRVTLDLTPTILPIDKTEAKLLISNLLSNAIKYSYPDKNIVIVLTHKAFTITDEGVGIPKEKQTEIFERFVRANDYAGGFGVGLHIVKSIAYKYGFTLVVDSNPNEGTTVTVTF